MSNKRTKVYNDEKSTLVVMSVDTERDGRKEKWAGFLL